MKGRLKTWSMLAAAAVSVASVAASAEQRLSIPMAGVGIPELDLQVLLDRAGFSPGEIDGRKGRNAGKALDAFRRARGLPPDVAGNQLLLAALGVGTVDPVVGHTITAKETDGPFNSTVPSGMLAQSKLPGLYYTSVLQALSGEFHAAPALLKRLNPQAQFIAGEQIRVPNVADSPAGSDPSDNPRARTHKDSVRVVVAKHDATLTVYDKDNQVVFYAPVTSGSQHDPLPLGHWLITEVVRNPIYNYNPALFWDANPANASVTVAAGPNNPVGEVWIDINKPHYGIHGTPNPARIGYAHSHGCVRLTNWDALALAALVRKGTRVVFEP